MFGSDRDLFYRRKIILANAAERTYPVIRKSFKSSSGSNSVVRITDFRIVNITTYITNIFFHHRTPFKISERKRLTADLAYKKIILRRGNKRCNGCYKQKEYYGNGYSTEIRSLYYESWEASVQYGVLSDEHAGEQFPNCMSRVLVSQYMMNLLMLLRRRMREAFRTKAGE